jgi:hypothetical protein
MMAPLTYPIERRGAPQTFNSALGSIDVELKLSDELCQSEQTISIIPADGRVKQNLHNWAGCHATNEETVAQ